MANYTPNYNLIKPLETEKYDIKVQNGNMDKLDTAVDGLQKEVTAHKNDYNELESEYTVNADLKVKNLLTDGNFASGITGWTITGATVVSTDPPECVVIATGLNGRVIKTINALANNIYYMSAEIKATSNLVKLYGGSTTPLASHSGSGNYELLSGLRIPGATTNLQFGMIDNRTSGWTNVSIKNLILVNMTDVFGVGNEATKEEMDTLVALVPDQWWDGELKPSQQLLLTWQLKMIRQNRNAIVALGGTIV